MNKEYSKQLGKIISEYRKAKGLSQAKLAELTGVNLMTINRNEIGMFCFKDSTLKKVCKELDISIDRVKYLANERTTQLKNDNVENVVGDDFIRVPLYSHLDIEEPLSDKGLLGVVSISSYDLDTSLTYFALRCKDDSMDADHITSGDTMIFIKTDNYTSSDILCLSADGVPLIRRVVKNKDVVALIPSNSQFHPLFLNGSKIKVYGVLRRLVKEY